jgi:UDP-N-acetylmuramate--L-alanine ligase
MNLNNINKIHFIGIGGVAMSAVAAIAKQRGYVISGSDGNSIYPPASVVLEKNEILFTAGYRKENIEDPDLVIISAGETPETNPEVAEVIERKIPYTSFPDLLYNLFYDVERVVVSGTHGKTTTSSLIAFALKAASNPSSFIIGGYVQDFKTNFELIDSQMVIIEGDEYYSSFSDKKPKFLHYHPQILLITNIDMDHFDYYRNIDDVMDKFRKLVKTVPPDGVIIACHDDKNVKRLLKDVDRKVIWYGLKGKNVNWKGEKIQQENDKMSFVANKLTTSKKYKITLSLSGEHNVLNTLASVALLDHLDCDLQKATEKLVEFNGPTRRFEIKGVANGVTIIDDYAHHPTAVMATLQAARSKYPESKIWAVFEPHTFSRTQATKAELAEAFEIANKVIITDIYPAREKASDFRITSQEIVDEIAKNHQNVAYIPRKKGVMDHIVANAKNGDVVIIMAVGDFNKIALELIDKL